MTLAQVESLAVMWTISKEYRVSAALAGRGTLHKGGEEVERSDVEFFAEDYAADVASGGCAYDVAEAAELSGPRDTSFLPVTAHRSAPSCWCRQWWNFRRLRIKLQTRVQKPIRTDEKPD